MVNKTQKKNSDDEASIASMDATDAAAIEAEKAEIQQEEKPTKPQPLEISTTEFVRNYVVIDGENYEIRHPDEISLPDRVTIARIGKKLIDMAEMSNSEAEIATREFNRIFDYVLMAPAEVRQRLKTGHKLSIIMAVFTQEGWKPKK